MRVGRTDVVLRSWKQILLFQAYCWHNKKAQIKNKVPFGHYHCVKFQQQKKSLQEIGSYNYTWFALKKTFFEKIIHINFVYLLLPFIK